MSVQMYPTYPEVRCQRCLRVYNVEGTDGRCPSCGAHKFNTVMEGNYQPVQQPPKGQS